MLREEAKIAIGLVGNVIDIDNTFKCVNALLE